VSLKALAFAAIAAGVRPPETPIHRYLELLHLKRLLLRLDVNCVLDVGANRGQFASEIRGIGYHGRIVSFEPIRQEFLVLQKAFAGDEHWRGYQLALGQTNASSEMHVFDSRRGMHSLLAPVQRPPDVAMERVEIRSLDSLFPELIAGIPHPRVFLKMDTQGYDVEVFRGALGSLDYVVGLQSELSVRPLYHGMPHYLEALSIYEAAGFALFDLSVVTRAPGGALQELNCFMTRAKYVSSPRLAP